MYLYSSYFVVIIVSSSFYVGLGITSRVALEERWYLPLPVKQHAALLELNTLTHGLGRAPCSQTTIDGFPKTSYDSRRGGNREVVHD
jgi:hypothetical protein